MSLTEKTPHTKMAMDSVSLALQLAPCCASLTPQQSIVLELAARGLAYKQIAYDLGVSEATVKSHMLGVTARLGHVTRSRAISGWLMFRMMSGIEEQRMLPASAG